MGVKYSFSRFVTATSVAAALLVVPSACKDDFDYRNNVGQQIAFKLSAPDAWHDGMSVNENAPTTRCLSVRPLSGGDTELYLHTVVADNPVSQTGVASRATPVNGYEEFKKTYPRFSLSGICYIGEYPTDESQNDWTTEYAYNLFYDSASGNPTADGRQLLWPSNGSVRFFAFTPTVPDFEKLNNGGSLTLSDASQTGSPTITYTVPEDVTKQIDLMTATETVTAATTPKAVDLNFGHALTAVRIKCGKGMLAGEITEVTIEGVNGTGTQVIGSDQWEMSDPAKYTISQKIDLPADEKVDGSIVVPEGKPITGTATDNLTFMLLPQTLPEGAKMTIKFTDTATGTERTLSGSIAGDKWETGKIVTYSISPSSINISGKIIGFSKKDGDVIPYSGVWYDAKFDKAQVEITQVGVDTKTLDIPKEKVEFQYKLEGEDEWKVCTKEDNGLLKIAPQPAYETMRNKFTNTKDEVGSAASPVSLTVNGKTANCYMVDQAGYFSLPLVYGNGNVSDPVENTNGIKYYPRHDEERMPTDGKISDVSDAVLCWQDAPDLIDPTSVKIDGEKLVFHIRKHTLTQGNALLAVRNSSNEIIWSWHIWVTPYKTDFYSKFYDVSADGYNYSLAKYNLGWCDSHAHNRSRNFSLRAIIDMSAYGGTKDNPVEMGTFSQDVFKGSDAGDNTYYQWGRKDPMLGGIYNDDTPKYTYKKKGTNLDTNEFTMENKQVFNQYNKNGCNYSFCKNPGDKIEPAGEASKGVTIGYAIQHPYMFITNSTDHETDKVFNYRNHWHIPYADKVVKYLNDKVHIMFNVWNSGAADAGYEYSKSGSLANNASIVTKSVFDPCPPEFQLPPIHALRVIQQAMAAGLTNYSDNAWTISNGNVSIKFPLTGVRNYALRSNEWTTVNPVVSEPGFNYSDFYKISMPAFQMLTFVSSATIVKKEDYNAYQVYILSIDKADRSIDPGETNLKASITPSSNSYGLSVRPMHYIADK
jgi:hypothetical protein